MKIEKETTVQKQDSQGAVKTIVPAMIREIMGIKIGTKLKWTLENENEVKITKKQDWDKCKNYPTLLSPNLEVLNSLEIHLVQRMNLSTLLIFILFIN